MGFIACGVENDIAKLVRRGAIIDSVVSGGRDCVRRKGSVEREIEPVSGLGENGRPTTIDIFLNMLRSFSRGKGIPG